MANKSFISLLIDRTSRPSFCDHQKLLSLINKPEQTSKTWLPLCFLHSITLGGFLALIHPIQSSKTLSALHLTLLSWLWSH